MVKVDTVERMPTVGQAVEDRYEIVRVLGRGGFACVYLARDLKAGGEVALKVLDPNKSDDPQFSKRFQQECMLVRSLRHPNTIKIWDVGQTKTGLLYMAMECVHGKPLDEVIRTEGAMSADRTIHIIEQVLGSLSEAHRREIVHRDLKPPNIMVSQFAGEPDYVKVLDFGIAKALDESMQKVKTQTGMVMCTPNYASPELLRGTGVVPATDLYSLGLIMIEMLTGVRAIDGESLADVIVKQMAPTAVTIPPHIASQPIAKVIARATIKDVEQRYQRAEEMLADLQNLGTVEATLPLVISKPVTAPVAQPAPSTPALVAYQPAPVSAAQPLEPGAPMPMPEAPPLPPAPTAVGGSSMLPWIIVAFLLVGGAAGAFMVFGGENTEDGPTGEDSATGHEAETPPTREGAEGVEGAEAEETTENTPPVGTGVGEESPEAAVQESPEAVETPPIAVVETPPLPITPPVPDAQAVADVQAAIAALVPQDAYANGPEIRSHRPGDVTPPSTPGTLPGSTPPPTTPPTTTPPANAYAPPSYGSTGGAYTTMCQQFVDCCEVMAGAPTMNAVPGSSAQILASCRQVASTGIDSSCQMALRGMAQSVSSMFPGTIPPACQL
jgi:serine/threonine-protein kinase